MVSDTQLIPAGYKQTDVGVIPEDWEIGVLGKMCKYQNGQSLERYFNSADGFRVISIGNYSPEGKYVDTKTYIDRSLKRDVKKYILNAGDLSMILNDKTPSGTILGRVLHISKDNTYVINQRTMRLTANSELSEYLYWLINSDLVHNKIVGLAKPGTQIYVNTSDVTGLEMPVPTSKTERFKIIKALSDIDSLISKLDQLIQKKKNIKQGAMQELLTGKRRLPGFSGEWENIRLGDLLQYEQPTKYIVSNTDYSDTAGVPVLTAGKSFILGYSDDEDGFFEKLPVIIFDDFTTDSKFVDFAFKVKSSAMKMLLPKTKEVDLRFVFEKVQLIDFPLGDHKRRWISEYQEIELSMPKYEEQRAITKILENMSSEISILELQRNKYQTMKQGVMQQLLTGKIRLI